MNRCNHNWLPLLPLSEAVSEEPKTRMDYAVAKMLARVSDMFYCDKCKRTGHRIKSHRGGVRVHYYSEGYIIKKANEIREEFNLPLLALHAD